MSMVVAEQLAVNGIDVTIIAQSIRVAPHRELMRQRLSELLQLPIDRVSIKATTTDGMGFIGADEGIAAVAVAVLEPTRRSE